MGTPSDIPSNLCRTRYRRAGVWYITGRTCAGGPDIAVTDPAAHERLEREFREFAVSTMVAIIPVLVIHRATDLSDRELQRCLGPCVAGPRLVQQARWLRDFGALHLEDVRQMRSTEMRRLVEARVPAVAPLPTTNSQPEKLHSLVLAGSDEEQPTQPIRFRI